MKIPNTQFWASCVTCLAMAAVALAQNQQSDTQQSSDQQQSAAQQQHHRALQADSRSDQQATQRDEYAKQRDQQSQQQRQLGQQSRQGKQQSDQTRSRQGDEEQWSRKSDSERGEFSRGEQWRREQIEQSGGRQVGGASLGVNIDSDGRPGIVVMRVHPGSPAEKMGIENQDRITQINGQEIQSVRSFISQIREMKPGEEVEISIDRNQDQLTLRGEVEAREQAFVRGPELRREIAQSRYEEQRGAGTSGERSGQISSSRLEQIEGQVDRLRQQIEDLRLTLRELRQQSGRQGETTAGYDELQQRTIESPRRSADRWDNTNRFRQADRTRGTGRSGEYQQAQPGQQPGQDESSRGGPQLRQPGQSQSGQSDQSPGGETGEDRQRVGAEDIRE